ncbi:MAG: hypothetical protein RL071_4322, partial [Pseudomonadota bacterium]
PALRGGRSGGRRPRPELRGLKPAGTDARAPLPSTHPQPSPPRRRALCRRRRIRPPTRSRGLRGDGFIAHNSPKTRRLLGVSKGGPQRAGARRCHAPREACARAPLGAGCKGARSPLAPGGPGAGPAPGLRQTTSPSRRNQLRRSQGRSRAPPSRAGTGRGASPLSPQGPRSVTAKPKAPGERHHQSKKPRGASQTTETLMTCTGALGRPLLEPWPSIFFTTSRPSVILPKTGCLLGVRVSNQSR